MSAARGIAGGKTEERQDAQRQTASETPKQFAA
jgi:hypothetical protein